MKRVFLAGVALAALMSTAVAADIPRRVVEQRAVVAPIPVAVAYNWTGFYAGIHAGWGWGNGSFSGPPPTRDFDVDGGLLGGQLGYNWQTNQFVFGVETDIAWSGIDGSTRCGGIRCRIDNNWLGTTRARFGFAADRFMPFIAAGVAYGEVEANATGNRGADDTRVGWTIGGGVEYALPAPRWTAKLEYLFVDLDDFACNRACGARRGPDNVSFDAHIVRAGFNYRF